jgi:thioredoxin-related protein
MKKPLAAVLCIIAMSFSGWQPDFETARKTALEQNRLILLSFSGSDWCAPCIRMKKEIFASEMFSRMADTTLVMVNADFPRSKKNQLSKEIQKANEELAEKYNSSGKFPYTVLLNTDGKVLKVWDGMPSQGVEQFTLSVKSSCDSYRN